MEKHFFSFSCTHRASAADIIWHAIKAFFSPFPFSCNKSLRDVNLRECFPLFFSTQFTRVKYNAMKLMPFIIIGYHSVMLFVLYIDMAGNKFLIDSIVPDSNVKKVFVPRSCLVKM